MRRLRSIPLLLACAVPFAVVAQDNPDPVDPNPEVVTVDVEALRAEIQQILDEHRIPGASIALVDRDRTIWAGGVGRADVAADIDVTADHLFRIGSISKSFTALAALRAVESGLLDLETPVRELAPEIAFTNPWEATHPVTVAMLMEHTTGFDDLHFPEWVVVDPEISLAEGLAVHPHSRVSRWPPGTRMAYNNSGPSVAAYIVEKVTGTPFEEYAREQVFVPLGMETSTFHVPRGADLLAKGYEPDGVGEAPYEHIIMRPSGSLNASARDMARYLRMMINRGTLDSVRLLAPETVTRMETPTTTLAAREGVTHGDGLGNTTLFVNGHHFRGHGGTITGFRSRSAYSSELGVGYFVSINKRSGAVAVIERLLGERLTEGFEPPRGPVAVLSDDELRAMTGSYQLTTPRRQFFYGLDRLLLVRRIILEEGKLFLLPTVGGGWELVPVTATSFRQEGEPVPTVFGGVDEEGNRILQTGRDGNYMRVGTARLRSQQAVALTTFLLLLSAPLFALVWGPARIFGRMKTIPLRTVLYPLLATLSIVVWFFLPGQFASPLDMGTVSGWSLTWFIGSLAFAALTALSLFVSFRRDSVDGGRLIRLHSRLVSLACTVTLLYAWNAGWIGLRTWAY
ncbi:serine hydrolase domain-containing protein [Candidatus Palauibacter sp.]|uniref:serine hydrolase domain-containing protein n=1 Tax=Candidatus Palauibacter sp. TaxID=3101350 RepID=UPI003B02075C